MSILSDGSLASRLIARLVAAGLPYSVVIRRTETSDDPFNPETTIVDYTASGWIDTFDARDVDGTLIKASDVKAFVLTSSVSVTPTTTDKLVANGTAYTIVAVHRDPAGACWVVQARV